MSETPTEIIPNLFVGDANSAENIKFLQFNGIKRIVNCTPDIPNYYENNIKYFRIPVYDHEDENKIMEKYIFDAINFIYKPTSGDAVLVHCAAGISRSCTIIAAYLRYYYCDNLDEVIQIILDKRPIAFSYGKRFTFLETLIKKFKK